jgi:hypothetical protein
MQLVLEIKNGPRAGTRHAIPESGALSVGRTDRATLAIPKLSNTWRDGNHRFIR